MNAITARPRILFVDDEPDLLAGLRLALRRERSQWDLQFAVGAEQGLAAIEAAPFDVVVTDMRMPGMDGAMFLGRVRVATPDAVRVVLSGQADDHMALRAIPVAHRWLTKPCDRDQIVTVLQQAITSRELRRRAPVRRVLGAMGQVPSLPRLHDELMQRIARPEFGLEEIAEVVGRDPGMAARVLQLANSALFRRPGRLRSLTDAVGMLGLRALSHLLLAAEVFEALRPAGPGGAEVCAEVERRALRMSRVAASVFGDDLDAGLLAATAGLLHEVGSLVLMQYDFGGYARALDIAAERGVEPDIAEREVFGADHAEVAAALLMTWGLPTELVMVMAEHHAPAVGPAGSGTAGALWLAEMLVSAPWLGDRDAVRAVNPVWLARAQEAALA